MMKFVFLLLISFLFLGAIKGGSYDKLKENKIFSSILDIKFPTIKKTLYNKYNKNSYWNFLIKSSSFLTLFCNNQLDTSYKKLPIEESKKNIYDFFTFLSNQENYNKGINFLFLIQYMSNIIKESFYSVQEFRKTFLSFDISSNE